MSLLDWRITHAIMITDTIIKRSDLGAAPAYLLSSDRAEMVKVVLQIGGVNLVLLKTKKFHVAPFLLVCRKPDVILQAIGPIIA
jgi:hypothetical protein